MSNSNQAKVSVRHFQAVLTSRAGSKLRPNALYLLAGGLGGIGKAFAERVVQEMGAKRLVLLSRFSMNAKGARDTVIFLQEAGAVIEVLRCDGSNSQDFSASLDTCASSMPLIRRVIQAAMGLQVSNNKAIREFLNGLMY